MKGDIPSSSVPPCLKKPHKTSLNLESEEHRLHPTLFLLALAGFLTDLKTGKIVQTHSCSAWDHWEEWWGAARETAEAAPENEIKGKEDDWGVGLDDF